MEAKATYDLSIGEALHAQLDAISLQVGVDAVAVPQMSPFPEQLTRPWEPEEPLYEEE